MYKRSLSRNASKICWHDHIFTENAGFVSLTPDYSHDVNDVFIYMSLKER